MIRKPMETNSEVHTVGVTNQNSTSQAGRIMTARSKSEGAAFHLKEQPLRWGSTKLWTLTFDLPGEKVNKLSKKVMAEVEGLLPELEGLAKQGKIDALILFSGKPGNFIAGADIEMIQATQGAKEAEELSRGGQMLVDRWEDLPFPTIAAIHGAALGGGCEFALASSAMVMSNDSSAKVGLPEVLLGLLPGMGGCIRLPRKVGLATALDLILTGKTLNGERALKAGLIEACLPKENFNESVLNWVATHLGSLKAGKQLAREPKLGGMGGKLGQILEGTPGRYLIFKKAREGVLAKTKGHYPSPLEILSILESTFSGYGSKLRGSTRQSAMEREAQGFGKVAATSVSKNLIRLFFMTEGVKKSKGVEGSGLELLRDVAVDQAAVLGAGVMGGGIAQLFADKNVPVRMKDLNTQALALGMQSASRVFQSQLKKKRLNQRQYLQKLNFIAPTVDFKGFQSVDLVVEAIVENIEVKKKVFQELESFVSEQCVVASNTSSLSITEMQKVFQHPERFVGMHFFNPVHKMPLVEVIQGEKSSDQAVSTVFQLSKKLGKTPIVVKDSPGFLVNRLLCPYLNEAVYLLAEGVSIPKIDEVLLEFGMPMGPMELIDEVGVDVGEKVSHILHQAFGDRMKPSSINSKAVAAGRLGKKNGKGLYVYEGARKEKKLDPSVYDVIGVKPSSISISNEEIIDRCILPMINEASRCLEEQVVKSAAEVDLGMIMGTGFPPFRGGLLRYADSLGIQTIVDRLKKYEGRFGARFTPAPALVARAKNGTPFYSHSSSQ